jgi:hypothetical protein
LETRDEEEAARRKAAAQIEQRKSMEDTRLVSATEKSENGQELFEYQIAEEYLLKTIREVQLDI